MHKLLRLGVLLIVVNWGCGLNGGPRRYIESIEELQAEHAARIHEIIRYSEDLDSAMLLQAWHQTRDYAEEAVYRIQELGPYLGDSVLFKASLHLLEAYQSVLDNEIPAMVKIVSKPGELADADEMRLSRLRRAVFIKLAQSEREFLKAGNEFRRKYIGITDKEEEEGTWFEEADTTSL